MARLIDAKALEKQIKEAFEDTNPVLMGQMLRWVRKQSTIDAIPVVRCKDCKHSKLPAVLTQKYGEPGTLTCHNWHSPCNKRNVKQDDFCSYGERRTE